MISSADPFSLNEHLKASVLMLFCKSKMWQSPGISISTGSTRRHTFSAYYEDLLHIKKRGTTAGWGLITQGLGAALEEGSGVQVSALSLVEQRLMKGARASRSMLEPLDHNGTVGSRWLWADATVFPSSGDLGSIALRIGPEKQSQENIWWL